MNTQLELFHMETLQDREFENSLRKLRNFIEYCMLASIPDEVFEPRYEASKDKYNIN